MGGKDEEYQELGAVYICILIGFKGGGATTVVPYHTVVAGAVTPWPRVGVGVF